MSETTHTTRDEPTEENNLSNLGQTAGGLLSMVGRTTESLQRGTEELTVNAVDTLSTTAFTVLSQVMEATRTAFEKTLRPLVVLKDGKGFFNKLGNSLKEVAVSTVWGNVKNLAVGTVGVTKTLLGAGAGEKWEFNELGISGLVQRIWHGLIRDIATSPIGLPTEDPSLCMSKLIDQAKEALAYQRQESLPEGACA